MYLSWKFLFSWNLEHLLCEHGCCGLLPIKKKFLVAICDTRFKRKSSRWNLKFENNTSDIQFHGVGNHYHSYRTWNNCAGVGILFVEEEDPSGFVRVTVKALIEGGSAEKTGQVKSGDMVVRVGNQDVIGKPLSILRTMIPGPIGSYCKLGFLRGGVALNSNAVQVCYAFF